MGSHSVAGRTAATAATANHVGAQFWNPHASARMWVTAIDWCKATVATADGFTLRRSTARGTAGSTVTPDIDNSAERDNVNVAGILLDLAAFSAQPTLDASELWRWPLPAAIGSGVMKVFPGKGISVPFGTGLCIVTNGAVILQPADVTFFFES